MDQLEEDLKLRLYRCNFPVEQKVSKPDIGCPEACDP